MQPTKPTKPTKKQSDQFDIGAVIEAPFQDRDWLKKSAIIGLLMFVPFVGGLNMMGWSKEFAKARAAGETDLPEANLDYIGSGWRAFLAVVPMFLIFMGVFGLGGAAIGAVAGIGGGEVAVGAFIGGLVGMYLGIIASATAGAVVRPAIDFMHVIDDEKYPGAAFGRQIELIRDGGMQYFLLFVATLVAGFFAQLGVIALFVGLFVTVPLAQAMSGAALAEFERVFRPKVPAIDLEGAVSSTSGSPFGVTL